MNRSDMTLTVAMHSGQILTAVFPDGKREMLKFERYDDRIAVYRPLHAARDPRGQLTMVWCWQSMYEAGELVIGDARMLVTLRPVESVDAFDRRLPPGTWRVAPPLSEQDAAEVLREYVSVGAVPPPEDVPLLLMFHRVRTGVPYWTEVWPEEDA